MIRPMKEYPEGDTGGTEMSMPSQQLGDQAKPRVRPRRSVAAAKEERAAFLFLTPWFAGLLLFLVIPLGYALYISMTDRRLISGARTHFIGLEQLHLHVHARWLSSITLST